VPNAIGQLTRLDYNALLDDFLNRFLHQAAMKLRLDLRTTAGAADIVEWVGEQGRAKLRAFSVAANKGSGATHPADRRRWLDFIITAHKHGVKELPSDILQQWLVDELKWPETIALDLAIEYENAIELLKRYDEER
jgi:hypothetical protein